MDFWTRQRVWQNLIGFLLFTVVGYLLLRWFEYRTVYQPSSQHDASGDELGRMHEEVSLTTSDGVRLSGWFFPARHGSPRAPLVFLVCHGNGGNISHRLPLCEALLATGAGVFVFDYRGYGHSAGRPNEEGTYRDAQDAYAWLRNKGFAATNIIAYGESLGGGVVAELALRETIGGLILQSTFTSTTDVGSEMFPWLPVRTVTNIRYDTRSKLPRLQVPVLVMHGRADSLIPFRHGERLFAAANEPKLFCELAGDHNDQPEANPRKFREGIEQFLRLIEKRPPPH